MSQPTRPSQTGIPIEHFINVHQLKLDVAINPVDLDNALIGQAALYVHYAELTIKARKQYERIKSSVEIIESKLFAEIRASLIAEGTPKPTEAMITSAIHTDSRWVGAQSKLIEAQSIWKMCESAENALGMRKDMVLELARDRRKEREGEQRVMEATAARNSVLEALKQVNKNGANVS